MSFQIRAIPFSGIVDYVSGQDWKTAPVLPITLERAHSQQNNPNASQENTCLWVAEDEEGEVLGFAGSLPASDFYGTTGVAWNTCWWVDPVRGKETALPLFFSFLQQWDQRVAFADMTSHTHAIIQQLDFCHTREEELALVYLRMPAPKIIAKLAWAGKILSPLINFTSFLVNKSVQNRLEHHARDGDADLTVSIAHMDEDIFSFVKAHRQQDFVHRSLEEYRWIEEYPWLITPDDSSREALKNYPFSHLVKSFRQEWLISCRNGVIVAVMFLSVRDGVLKILSYFGNSSVDAMEALNRYVLGHKEVQVVIFAHPDLLEHKETIRRISLKTTLRSRWVGVSKKIMDPFPNSMVIQLGDGDSAFT